MKNILETMNRVNAYLKEQDRVGTLTYRSETSHMVRCGRSQISLNVTEKGEKFFFNFYKGKKNISGSISAGSDDYEKLTAFADKLYNRIDIMPDVEHRKPIKPIVQEDLTKDDSDSALTDMDTSHMVQLFKRVDEQFQGDNLEVSGAFSAGTYAYGVVNTLSDSALGYQGSDYNIEVVLQLLDHDKKEVRAAQVGESLNQYDPDAIIADLVRTHLLKTSTERIDLPAGEYDVVFHADAVGEMLKYMGHIGFRGEAYEYGISMFQKDQVKIGDKVFGDNITLTDDPSDPEILFRRALGKNGIGRKEFKVVENGVLRNFYYSDKDECDRFNVEPNNDVDVAAIKLMPGDGPSDWDEMVQSCQHPTIFIPFIHYMNFTNPSKGEFTGTSRFGTFLVDKGEIQNHLYNLRINDSYKDLFKQVEWLSDKLTHVNQSDSYGMRMAGSVASPVFVKINGVKITGSSAPNRG